MARTGQRSAGISAPVVNDARWEQSLSNLTSGQSYALCGWLRGQDVATTSQAPVGANVSIIGGFVRSDARSGTFDWAELCVVFKPETTPVVVGCRIGFFGSTVTGRLWCDDLSLAPLRSAF